MRQHRLIGGTLPLERERVELEAWRVKSLAELRGWLKRDVQILNQSAAGWHDMATAGAAGGAGAVAHEHRVPVIFAER